MYVFGCLILASELVGKVKVGTFIFCRLQGNQNSSIFQCAVAYWPALTVGRQIGNKSLFLVASNLPATNWYSFTYPRRMEGWVGLSSCKMSVNLLGYYSTAVLMGLKTYATKPPNGI